MRTVLTLNIYSTSITMLHLSIFSKQKMLSECQGQRNCQVLVNYRLFGSDLCPGTTKHLHVLYSCKPSEYSPCMLFTLFLFTPITLIETLVQLLIRANNQSANHVSTAQGIKSQLVFTPDIRMGKM